MGFTYKADGPTFEFNKPPFRVEVKNNKIDGALRKLKKKCQDEGIFQEARIRQYYEKPSAVRARKKAMAIKRWDKRVREELQEYYMNNLSKAEVESIRQKMERDAKKKEKKEEQKRKYQEKVQSTNKAWQK